MSDYFINFPQVVYNGSLVRDITRRTNFVDTSLADPFVFLPYTIKEGEKAEDISHFYYGDVSYTWLVLMANDIFNVYEEWPMDEDTLTEYIITKYAEKSGKTGYDVIAWAQDKTPEFYDNIAYYYDETNKIKLSTETVKLSFVPPPSYTPITFYELEKQLNENKREIVLVESQFKNQITNELKRLINK